MKKGRSLVLVFAVCILLFACGNSAVPAGKTDAPSVGTSLPKDIRMYSSGAAVKTNFGEITILDAAFCGKAQLIDALPHPTYYAAGEGRIVFAMRALISNTTSKDLVLFDDLKVSVQYGKEDAFGCSKGGNYKSSDPLYKTLPAGASGEYIICGRIPVETYQANNQFSVFFNDEELGFAYDEVQVYNSMGYQDGDNTATSIERVIASAGMAPADNDSTEKTEAADEFAFSLEDARYEITNDYFAIEVKIRNDSDTSLLWPVFHGVILDKNGDILENCTCSYSNGLEAGQAGWEDIRITESATMEAMAAIKFVTMWYKEDPQSPSHNLRFDLPEPLVVDIQTLEKK